MAVSSALFLVFILIVVLFTTAGVCVMAREIADGRLSRGIGWPWTPRRRGHPEQLLPSIQAPEAAAEEEVRRLHRQTLMPV